MKIVLVCAVVLAFLGAGFLLSKENESVTRVSDIVLKKETVSILSFGDVMFDRGVRNIIEKRGRDPFEYIKKDLDVIKKYDVVIANLEGPIVEMSRGLCQNKAYNFQFASTTTDRLKSIGITMVTIANNHSFDCYGMGFLSTKKYLEKVGIEYIGDSSLEKSFVIKTIADKKVAFVGMDQTVSPLYISNFYPLIKRLKAENDYVVVHIHWGTEYALTETKVQSDIAHSLIDNGADVIFGHHPHVIEPVRVYKGKLIFYSLGNFVFDQVGVEQTQGIGAGVEFGETKNTFTILPYKIKSFAPDFLKDKERDMFCEKYLGSLVHTGCTFEIMQ